MTSKKSISLVLAMFTLLMLFALPAGGGGVWLQTTTTTMAAAQSDDDDEDAAGDALGSLEQDVDDEATTEQDSSADDNVLANDNEFGEDIAVVDQDNEAEQDAANIGLQEQEQELTQDAANIDVNRQVAEQVQTLTEEPPTEPPEDEGVYCYTLTTAPGLPPLLPFNECFSTVEQCQEGRDVWRNNPTVVASQCERFEEPPPGCVPQNPPEELPCSFVGQNP